MTPLIFFDAGVWWCKSNDLAVFAPTQQEAYALWERCQRINEDQS